ncbi:MAG: VCBS repeat-containing protein [Chloroflexota bacterium]
MQPGSYTHRALIIRRLSILLLAFLIAGGGLLGILTTVARAATTSMRGNTSALAPEFQSFQLQPMLPEQLPDADPSNVRHTQSLAWGDMDGDGDLDLAVGNGLYWQERLGLSIEDYDQHNQVYLNNGQGRFTAADIAPDASPLDSRSVAWGDWDGDGDLDLAVGNGGSWSGAQANQVFENTGGVLSLAPEDGAGWVSAEAEQTSSVSWGDWDSDGDLDLAVGNEDAPNRVYENITGTLQLSATLGLGWSADEAQTTLGIAWGDWDGDGDLDLATANYGQGDRVYENISDTLQFNPDEGVGWQAPEERLTQAIAWGDWDNDGDLDLAVGGGSRDLSSGSFLIIYENEDGTLQLDPENNLGFELINESGLAAFSKPSSLVWADWDNDDDLDLIVGNNAGGGSGRQNQIYLNDGGQSLKLGWQRRSRRTRFRKRRMRIAAGDADSDGDLDLAVGNGGRRNGGQVNLLFRNELPAISFGQYPAWVSPDQQPTTSIAWGDWDDDGDLDLVAGNDGVPNVVYENEEGKLNLDLDSELGWQATVTDTARTMAVAWGDWDGDGDLDLVVGNDGSPNLVYENDNQALLLDPAAGFGWRAPISDTIATRSVAWGDWDSDGDLDLAVGSEGDYARVYENDGGSLQLDPEAGLGWQSPITMTARSVAWADWDKDDDLDLTLGARVYENLSGEDLVLDGSRGWNGNIPANGVAWGDYDGDGDRDLAVAIPSGRARVYENLGGSLAFSVRQNLGWQSFDVLEATGVAWGDADGDGDLDLAFSVAAGEGFEPNVVFENDSGVLSDRPAWTTPDTRPDTGQAQKSQSVAWGDVDGDGDQDLAYAGYCTGEDCESPGLVNEIYLNALQRRRESLPGLTVSLVNVSDPDDTAAANFYASPDIVGTNVISIPYRVASINGTPVGQVKMYYSLDGGDNWRTAQASASTQTTDLAASPAGTDHVFGWDTFQSDFFGRSDDVVMRIEIFPAPPIRSEAPGEPYRYFNAVSGSFQRPTATSVTFPFRVQSTQVRVVDEAGNGLEGAVVFRLPEGQVDGALWMPEATRPQVTDANGYSPGGGTIAADD